MAAELGLAVITDRHDGREAVDDRVEQRDAEERREPRVHVVEAHQDQERDPADGRDRKADAPRELLLKEEMRPAAARAAVDDAARAGGRGERRSGPAGGAGARGRGGGGGPGRRSPGQRSMTPPVPVRAANAPLAPQCGQAASAGSEMSPVATVASHARHANRTLMRDASSCGEPRPKAALASWRGTA